MMWEKREDVLDWLAGVDVEELDILDQFMIVMAFENFIRDIKPIMKTQLKEDEKYKIDWDSFFLNYD